MATEHGIRTVIVKGRFLAGSLDGPDPDVEPDAAPLAGLLVVLTPTPTLLELQLDDPPSTMLLEPFTLVTNEYGTLQNPETGAVVIRIPADYPATGGGLQRIVWKSDVQTAQGRSIISKQWSIPEGATEVDLTTVTPIPNTTVINLTEWEALAATIRAAKDIAYLSAQAAQQAKADTQALVAAAAAITGLTGEDEAVALLIGDAGSATRTALADVASPPKITQGQRLVSAIEFGVRDVNMCVLGDSTGTNDLRWVRNFVDRYATAHPSLKVVYTDWSDPTQSYNTPVVVQNGAAVSDVVLTSDTFERTAAEASGTYPNVGAAWQGTAGRFSINGTALSVDAAGLLYSIPTAPPAGNGTVKTDAVISLDFTPGAATARTVEIGSNVVSTSSHIYVAVSAGTSGGLTWSLWQRLTAGTTKLADGTPIQGHATRRNVSISVQVAGNQASATVDGETIMATLAPATVAEISGGRGVTIWAKNASVAGTLIESITSTVAVVQPSQTLTVHNGSHAGSKLEYQLARVDALVPTTTDLVIINSSHNYGVQTADTYIPAVKETLDAVKVRAPNAEIVLSGQNPQFAPRSAAQVGAHAARIAGLREYAATTGLGYLPVYETWRKLPGNGRAWIMSDGLHPLYDATEEHNGNTVWAMILLRYMESLEMGLSLTP